MSDRLNLGCGGQIVDGWINLDRELPKEFPVYSVPDYEAPIRVRYDLTDLPLPFEDDTVEMAVAHHVFDLLEPADLDALLADIFRVLEPGGVLRVSLFDVALAAAARDRGDRAWFRARDAFTGGRATLDEAFAWMVRQGGARKWVSTPFLFGQVLETAGFKVAHTAFNETVYKKSSICDLDSREGESFFVDAVKPSA